MEDTRVAAVCMHSEPGQVQRNLDRIRSFVLDASAADAQMVCFPELSMTGYTLQHPERAYAGLDPAWSMAQLLQTAKEAGLIVIAGMIEVCPGMRPWITQIIAGPDGIIGRYRKTHLSPAEKGPYQSGQEIQAYTFGNTVLGIALCYEAHFPEISTVLALQGAEILLFPHASPRGDPEVKSQSWLRHLPSRAFDNGAFVVACNQVGDTAAGFSFPGVCLVLGPNGQVLAKYAGDAERILYADLKADALQRTREHRMRYFIPQRRPELYQKIVES
jgi:N-carbamoylputrescine amidase